MRLSVVLSIGSPPVRSALLLAVCAFLVSCSGTLERRDPTGERFPSVEGTSLADKPYAIPEDFAGAPVVLLVGYIMETQFDLDRWLVGLAQAGLDVRVYEIPTIPGLVPGMFAGAIDSGMRSGIPKEDWGSVITVYGDGGEIVRFTGNEGPRNGRVLLLDGDGKVVFFHDRGFSAGVLMQLGERLKALKAETPPGA
jgi:hypothetical protein